MSRLSNDPKRYLENMGLTNQSRPQQKVIDSLIHTVAGEIPLKALQILTGSRAVQK